MVPPSDATDEVLMALQPLLSSGDVDGGNSHDKDSIRRAGTLATSRMDYVDRALGIVLTTTMLTVVLTGFIGQYFVTYVADEMQEAQSTLRLLYLEYDDIRRDARWSARRAPHSQMRTKRSG